MTSDRSRLLNLIEDLTDPDDCYFDHHGGCQAHGYLSLEPGERCPHAEAKELLAAADAADASERPEHTTAAIDAIRQALAAEQRGFADWLSGVLAAAVRGVDIGPEGVPFAPPGSRLADCVAELIHRGEALEGGEPS